MSEVTEAPATELFEAPAAVTEDQNTAPPDNSESGTESTEAETTKPEPPPETEEQKRSKYQRRIDRKNAEIAAARTEARIFKERLDQLEAQRNVRIQPDQSEPRLDQFENFDDYQAANRAWLKTQAKAEIKAELKAEADQEKAQRDHFSTAAEWQKREQKAAAKYGDYVEVMSEADNVTITAAIKRAIVESEVGPDIAYYLAHRPEEAERIAQLSPTRQIAEIGKLEDKVSKPPVRKTTEAPAPIVPAGSKAKAEKEPTQMTDAEFAAWRKRTIAKRY